MADFLYLFRGGGGDMTGPEAKENMQKWGAWMKSLGKQFKSGEPLDGAAKVLKGKSKNLSSKPVSEVVTGYLKVQAPSLAKAVSLAKGCPIFEMDGSVEVREIKQM